MHIHAYACRYMHIHAYTCIYMHVYAYTYIAQMHAHMYMHKPLRTCIHMCSNAHRRTWEGPRDRAREINLKATLAGGEGGGATNPDPGSIYVYI